MPMSGAGSTDARKDAKLIPMPARQTGTTSKPKLVPLSEANLLASARNIARTLELTAADRCLNIMPLFHIHGIAAALLSTLASGGSVEKIAATSTVFFTFTSSVSTRATVLW